MKIYFSCSVTGGRADQPIYAAIVESLRAAGHTVLTAHLAEPSALEDQVPDPQAVYARDLAWLDEADVVAAEVSTPSHGVGYQVAHAVLLGKRVICLAQAGRRVSKMITGNPRLTFIEYEEAEQAFGAVARFIGRGTEDRFA